MNGAAEAHRENYRSLRPVLGERSLRHWAAAEAHVLGHGGVSRVAEATGMSRGAVHSGPAELELDTPPSERVDDSPLLEPGRSR